MVGDRKRLLTPARAQYDVLRTFLQRHPDLQWCDTAVCLSVCFSEKFRLFLPQMVLSLLENVSACVFLFPVSIYCVRVRPNVNTRVQVA